MRKYLLMILCFYSTAIFAAVKCKPSGNDDICYRLLQKRFTAQLEEAGKEMERLDKPTAERFYTAQQHWLKFVESNCLYESEPMRNSLGAGYARVQQTCITLMYDERLNEANKKIRQLKQSNSHK